MGYVNVMDYAGGKRDWQAAGLALESDEPPDPVAGSA
jgi:hypothetical protein